VVSYFPSLGGDGLVTLRNYKLNLRCYRVFGLLPRSAWSQASREQTETRYVIMSVRGLLTLDIINMANSHMANCCEGSPLVDSSFHFLMSLKAGELSNLLTRR